MYAICMMTLMACIVVGVCNAFRRVSRGFSQKANRYGHIWPLSVGGFTVFSMITYNLGRSVLHMTVLLDRLALGVTVLCVAATVALVFYDPMTVRNTVPRQHPGAAGKKA